MYLVVSNSYNSAMTVIAQDDHLYGRPSPPVSEIAIVSQTKVKKNRLKLNGLNE